MLDTVKRRILTKKLIREDLERLRMDNAKARQEEDTGLHEVRGQIADVELKLAGLLGAVEGGVDLSAAQGRINDRNRELQALKIRLAELEKQRERALRIPEVTDAAVSDVLAKLHAVLATTEPKELKAILGHFIEKIEVEGQRATFFYTFAEPRAEIVSSAGDPEGI